MCRETASEAPAAEVAVVAETALARMTGNGFDRGAWLDGVGPTTANGRLRIEKMRSVIMVRDRVGHGAIQIEESGRKAASF